MTQKLGSGPASPHIPILHDYMGVEAPSEKPLGFPDFFWAAEAEWREAHWTLDQLFQKYAPALGRVRESARQARENLEQHFPLFDRFAAQLCPDCVAACCLHARVAYDFTDLVFMHALSLTPPPHQLRRHDREHCRYLGDKGCALPRILRPFICTWYYCAPMLELFRQEPPRDQRRYSAMMSEAQRCRRMMEEEFIRVVTKGLEQD